MPIFAAFPRLDKKDDGLRSTKAITTATTTYIKPLGWNSIPFSLLLLKKR
jgi:hypothetical protein